MVPPTIAHRAGASRPWLPGRHPGLWQGADSGGATPSSPGVPKPAGRPRSRPPRTTPPAQAAPADREHLHGHNGVLDLLRRAARWRAHPPGWGCPTRTG